eukprot:213090-Amorphochlora_amoeboformis.AAC.1
MQWHKELKEHRPDIPVIVVANKIDENMKATSKKFKFATERGFKLFYCSAADGTNVVKVFKEAIRLAVENSQKPSDDFTEEVMRTIEYFDEKEKAEAYKKESENVSNKEEEKA